MNNSKASFKPHFIRYAIAALFVLACLITLFTQIASALSPRFTDADQTGSTLIVSVQDATLRLQAPTATFIVFSPTANFNVVLENVCRNFTLSTGDAINYPRNEQIYAWANNASENRVGTAAAARTPTDCGSQPNITLPISGAQRTSRRGDINLYSATVVVTRLSAKVGSFRVVAPTGGYATYEEIDYAHAIIPDNPTTINGRPSFAIVDEQFNNANQRNYTLRFGTDCNIRSNQTVYLKWEDADVGRSNEVGAPINFQLLDDTAGGTPVSLQVLNTGTGVLATTTTVSGLNLLGGYASGTDGAYARARFTAIPDHKYRWVWSNVDGNNGIQIWMPFNQINYLADCSDWDLNPRFLNTSTPTSTTIYPGSNITLGGDTQNVGTTTKPSPYTFGMRAVQNSGHVLLTSPAGGTTSGSPPNAVQWVHNQAIGAGSNGTDRTVVYRVDNDAPPGAVICFRARVMPDTPTVSGWDESANRCYTVSAPPNWRYEALRPTGVPAPGATVAKPGQVLNITGTVDNTGNGNGLSYAHRLQVQRNGSPTWSNFYSATAPAITPAQAPQGRTDTYTIPANAFHGEQFCFRTSATPYAGVSAPTIIATSTGSDDSPPLCYTVYNLVFNLRAQAPSDTTAGAGETVSIPAGSMLVCNFDPNTSDGAWLGMAPDIAVSINTTQFTNGSTINQSWDIPSGGTATTVYGTEQCRAHPSAINNLQVPSNANIGDEICATISATPRAGFSDGTGLNNGSVSDEFCVTVSDGPYLQVIGHDTWSGGNFNSDNNPGCTPIGPGAITSRTRTDNGGVGAMDQFAAFALGGISGFGTANNALSTTLAFANTPAPGGYGATRCLSNLFDNGGAGGNVDDALWNNVTSTTSLGSLSGSTASGQYRTGTGGSTFSVNAITNFSNKATILINGNLDIRGNITLAAPNAPSNVPMLVFIVSGNIRISESATRIDGVYISRQQIDTCSSGSPLSPRVSLTASICDEHLEVNGSLVANDLALRRTHGGTSGPATNNLGRCLGNSALYPNPNRRCSAETVIFHPWMWLADPFFNRGEPATDLQIQQLRDLPPVF